MCVVSMVMDHYRDNWSRRTLPGIDWPGLQTEPRSITPEEIREFRELLERARQYDKEHNEPDCELDSKRQAVRDIAKQLGVEIEFL